MSMDMETGGGAGRPNWEHATSERLLNYADMFASEKSLVPKVQGRDLISRGLMPGPASGLER